MWGFLRRRGGERNERREGIEDYEHSCAYVIN